MKMALLVGIAVILVLVQGMLFNRWFDASLFAPNSVLLAVMASVVVFGFERSFPFVLIVSVVYEIFLSDQFALIMALVVMSALGMSLLLRRASILHKTTMMVSIVYVIVTTVVFHTVLAISGFGWNQNALDFFDVSRDGWMSVWSMGIFFGMVMALRMFSSFVFSKKSYDALS